MIDVTNKKDRSEFRKNPHTFLNYLSKDIDIVVKTNTKSTVYLVLQNTIDNQLVNIQVAGDTAGTVGTVGSLSTFGCASTSGGTVGCLSTAGSAGSLGSVGSKGCD